MFVLDQNNITFTTDKKQFKTHLAKKILYCSSDRHRLRDLIVSFSKI